MVTLAGFKLQFRFSHTSFAKTLVVTDDPSFTVAISGFTAGATFAAYGSTTVMVIGLVGQLLVCPAGQTGTL